MRLKATIAGAPISRASSRHPRWCAAALASPRAQVGLRQVAEGRHLSCGIPELAAGIELALEGRGGAVDIPERERRDPELVAHPCPTGVAQLAGERAGSPIEGGAVVAGAARQIATCPLDGRVVPFGELADLVEELLGFGERQLGLGRVAERRWRSARVVWREMAAGVVADSSAISCWSSAMPSWNDWTASW